jgi:hypothetical protein
MTVQSVNEPQVLSKLAIYSRKETLFIQDMKAISISEKWRDVILCAPIPKVPSVRVEIGQRLIVSLQDEQVISKVKIDAS